MTLPSSEFGSRLASAEPLAAAEPVAADPLAAFDDAAEPAAEPAGDAADDDAAPPPDDEQAASASVSVARTASGRGCVRIEFLHRAPPSGGATELTSRGEPQAADGGNERRYYGTASERGPLAGIRADLARS